MWVPLRSVWFWRLSRPGLRVKGAVWVDHAPLPRAVQALSTEQPPQPTGSRLNAASEGRPLRTVSRVTDA